MINHHQLQQAFPGKTYTGNGNTSLAELFASGGPKIATTQEILAELEPAYQEEFGESFIDAVIEVPGSEVQKNPTPVEKKREKRRIQRDCKNKIEDNYNQTDAMDILAGGMSMSRYKRLRLSQSFESPEAKRARSTAIPTKKKHSPTLQETKWDKEQVLRDLRNFPTDQQINWSKFAREHNVPGKNNGQVLKEFADENGIDTFQLDKREKGTRVRAKKLRLPGNDISVPVHTAPDTIKQQVDDMIKSGEFMLGEQCNPNTIEKVTIKNGQIKKDISTVYGRKIPLIDLRRKLLEKHEPYMHLHSDTEIASMSRTDLKQTLRDHNIEFCDMNTDEDLRELLSQAERTRTLGIWHDHSTLLGHGYILVTVKVMYDTAVFKTTTEMAPTTRQSFPTRAIQSLVEEPDIHILAMSSSSIEDQVSLIQDRIQCMKDLSTKLKTRKGIEITDQLMFSVGTSLLHSLSVAVNKVATFPVEPVVAMLIDLTI